MSHPRREQKTKWARRNREAQVRARLGGQLHRGGRCLWPMPGGKPCGGAIRTDVGRLGQTVIVCDRCDRRAAGICRDCSARVEGGVGRALRCAVHKEVARQAQVRECQRRHREYYAERHRQRYAALDAEKKRVGNEKKAAWRKANPDKVRAQKARYVSRHRNDPTSWYKRYHAKYRAKYRHQKRELERDRFIATAAGRKTSPKCNRCGKSTRWKPVLKGGSGGPWATCTKCLYPCQRRERMRNRRRARARAKEWLESGPPATKIKRPPLMTVRGPGWERTCLTPGCDIVVTHRKKKCTRCRERDRQQAEAKLAPFRGRGRRVDLEQARGVA